MVQTEEVAAPSHGSVTAYGGHHEALASTASGPIEHQELLETGGIGRQLTERGGQEVRGA